MSQRGGNLSDRRTDPLNRGALGVKGPADLLSQAALLRMGSLFKPGITLAGKTLFSWRLASGRD